MALATATSQAMLDALAADGPHPAYADKLALFGRLVGSWDITGRFFDTDGNVTAEHEGEWHFGWVLEGRVVQDVLITPRRRDRGPGEPAREYGTTLRAYDPTIDAWRVTFVAPVFGATVTLLARDRGDEIWLEGVDPQGQQIRWTFSDFTDTSVRWQGYTSPDDGQTWVRDEEILLSRTA